MTERLDDLVAKITEANRHNEVPGFPDISHAMTDFEYPRKSGRSISARTGRLRDRGSRWGCIACALLTILFNISPLAKRTRDHCDDAMGR